MQDKIVVLLIYAVLGLLLALSPSLSRNPPGRFGILTWSLPDAVRGYWALTFAAVTITLLYLYTQAKIQSPFFWVVAALAIGFGIRHRKDLRNALQASSATVLGCTVGATLIWWRRQQPGIDITINELLLFAALLVISASGLLARRSSKPPSRPESAIFLGTYVVVVAYFSYSLATMSDPNGVILLWHHWGAYIDPAQVVMAGARLLHDIPVQYGAGPTLLLASACGSDCWESTYWVVATTTFAFASLIGAMAWLVASGARFRNALILLVCIVTCIFWIAYPPSVLSPNVMPSTNGLRFLPAVMLASWILFTADRNFTFHKAGGHLLWIVGAIWSPEALFHVTAIWWPVYLFDCTIAESNQMSRFRRLVHGLLHLLLLAAATIFAVCLIYRLIYGVFPVPQYLIAYMLYPPGPLPINPRGPVWYFALSMTSSVCVAWLAWKHTGNPIRFRRSLTLQLMAFSTFSYFLGRSHDNNLLNVLPFIMLVLFDTVENAKGIFTRQTSAILVAALLAWVAVFGWERWEGAYRSDSLTEFGFSATRARLRYDDGLVSQVLPISKEQSEQTIELMDELSSRGDPFVVMDQNYLLQPHYPAQTWSAIQSATNFEYLPSALRREFLQHTADHLQRSGWLIVARSHDTNSWLDDFDAVYNRIDQIDRSAVYAIRFAPKR